MYRFEYTQVLHILHNILLQNMQIYLWILIRFNNDLYKNSYFQPNKAI